MKLSRLIMIAVISLNIWVQDDTPQPINQHDCETCGCQGLADAGPLAMATGRTVKVWLDKGTMGQLSQADSRRLLLQGIGEFDDRCGLDFQIVEKRSQARVRVSFVKSATWLGFAWSNGNIKLNSGRKLPDALNRRYLQAVIGHELGHMFGLVHGGDRNDIMNADLGYYYSPAEVKRLQQLHGKSSGKFYPLLRAEIGKKIRQIGRDRAKWIARRTVLIGRRAQLVKDGKWSAKTGTHLEIVKLNGYLRASNANLAKLNKEWHTENNRWRGVTGAVTF